MILNERNEVLKDGKVIEINGKTLKVGSKVLVSSLYGEYETTVIQEGFAVILEENLTVMKDNFAIELIKDIL